MGLVLKKIVVGQWPMNSYIVYCDDTGESAVIDPGADSNNILSAAIGLKVEKILITHGHEDHIGALNEIILATQAPVYMSSVDADIFGASYDVTLVDKQEIVLGKQCIKVIHTPGHTPGMMCFSISEERIIVGDTIFVGGPGKTWNANEFAITMQTMQDIVFRWPDETNIFPGHGPSGVIGLERPAFNKFIERGWEENIFGDVTWDE